MQTFNTIGKNYETTLRYINDASKSEWYVEPATDSMPLSLLKANYQKLLDQVNHWLDLLNGANRKEIENLSKILDNQNKKIADYEKIILEKEKTQEYQGGGSGGDNPHVKLPPEKLPPEDLPPALKNSNKILVYGLIAVAALIILKK